MKRPALAAGLVCLWPLSLAGCVSERSPLDPGNWEITTEVIGPAPASRILSTATTTRCLGQSDMPDANLLTGTRFAGCPHLGVDMTDGRISGDLRCTKEGTAIHETVEGKYQPASFEATRIGEFVKGDNRFTIEVRGRGRRIGDCRPGSAAAGGAAATLVRPGRWTMKATTGDIELPDVPPDMANIGAAEPETTSFDFCMTAEMASDAESRAFTGIAGANCAFQSHSMRGGKIAAKGLCRRGEGPPEQVMMTGAYEPERYHIRQMFEQDGGPFVGRMKYELTIEARRVGECTGDERKLPESAPDRAPE